MVLFMNESNADIAEKYYSAMGNKDVAGMGKYLHSDIHFVGPLAEIKGKEEVLDSVSKLLGFFKTLTITIRAKLDSKDQAMLAYDLDCSEPIGKLRVAALLDFRDGLISKIELFFDARAFDRKKD